MTEIRRNLITGEPILFAPERAERSGALGTPSESVRCPFCPGNEEDTPPEIARVGDPWRVRVVPNRYPSAPGAEVIVETPHHDETFDRIDRADEAIALLLERVRAHREAAYVAVFKNHGPRAGASIPHAHSQIIPLPFVPPRIAQESNAFAKAPGCPLCSALDEHRRAGLVIREDHAFAWIAPASSSMAYQQWIIPKRHIPAFVSLNAAESLILTALLQSASTSMLKIAPSYNWTLQSFPNQDAHAYIELYPRLTTVAGLELGTGTFVEIIDPAAAARRLRD